ncbi:hypothetical protein BLA29_007226, partial [Euroglyphus maynei]
MFGHVPFPLSTFVVVKYQNYDPVYQSLRAAADARKCAQYVTEHYSNYNNGGGGGSGQKSIHHSSASNINNQSGGSGSGNKQYSTHHQQYHHDSSGSGSSGSISNKQIIYGNGICNTGNGKQSQPQQQSQPGSNDSLIIGGGGGGSQPSLIHGQQPQHRQDLSFQQQPQPMAIKITHRNSDSEFHQSTIEYHQQQY